MSKRFRKTTAFLEKLEAIEFESALNRIGELGVKALSESTPRDSGETSRSWSYSIKKRGKNYTISWSNSVMAGSVPLVLLLQYGHGLKGGGYVYGKDFINPAMTPVKQKLIEEVVQEVLHG